MRLYIKDSLLGILQTELIDHIRKMPQQKENIKLPRSLASDRELKRTLMGTLIRELREARDITYENFAAETGISRSNLIRVENGQNPSSDTLDIILCGLSITDVEFYTIIHDRMKAEKKAAEKKPANKKTKSQQCHI